VTCSSGFPLRSFKEGEEMEIMQKGEAEAKRKKKGRVENRV